MRDYMLKCWSIRKVENHCLSTLTPPSTRMLLPLVLSHLIWGWKRECCQDSNNVMIKGPEEKHKHIFFFWGKHTCHGQIRWNLSRRSGRDCHGREDSKLPGFQSGFASYHLCELESQEQNSFQIPALLGLFSVQIRVLGKSGKLLSKTPAPGLCLPCQGGEDSLCLQKADTRPLRRPGMAVLNQKLKGISH